MKGNYPFPFIHYEVQTVCFLSTHRPLWITLPWTNTESSVCWKSGRAQRNLYPRECVWVNESCTTDLLSRRSLVSLNVPALHTGHQRDHHHDPPRAGDAPDARGARPDGRTRGPAHPRYEPTYTNV
jgi:hypothetical protein